MMLRLRQLVCRHHFDLADLRSTGIPEPERPKSQSFYVWLNYFMSLADHPSHRERVEWACSKCHKTFRAHCGIDILSRHGSRV